jgi:hypothetical protein
VNPYEVARLARNKGLSTTEFIANYLEPRKPFLGNRPDGACVFLTEQGCGVHTDRPLVCRIYPLEQRLTGEGDESFHYATPHPETKGVYGQTGTVNDFLTLQGLPHFLEVRNRYVAVVYRLLDILAQDVEDNEEAFTAAKDGISDEASIQQAVREWLDLDVVVDRHCQAKHLSEPTSLEVWIIYHSTGGNHETSS